MCVKASENAVIFTHGCICLFSRLAMGLLYSDTHMEQLWSPTEMCLVILGFFNGGPCPSRPPYAEKDLPRMCLMNQGHRQALAVTENCWGHGNLQLCVRPLKNTCRSHARHWSFVDVSDSKSLLVVRKF